MVNKSKEIKVTEKENLNNLNLQSFMDDMSKLGDQIRDKNLKKPTFHYGDLGVTNFLLWLMLGELKILNKKIGKK